MEVGSLAIWEENSGVLGDCQSGFQWSPEPYDENFETLFGIWMAEFEDINTKQKCEFTA